MLSTIVVTLLKIMVTILVTPSKNFSHKSHPLKMLVTIQVSKSKYQKGKQGTRTEGRVAPRSSSKNKNVINYIPFSRKILLCF